MVDIGVLTINQTPHRIIIAKGQTVQIGCHQGVAQSLFIAARAIVG
jgi:hypothetical protein